MANPNPHQARMAKRRLRKPGDVRSLQRMLWQALIECERVLMHAEDDEMTLRAAHAIGQVSGQYAKVIEIG
jgi:transcriptional regulator of aromatic amino acid metabolism